MEYAVFKLRLQKILQKKTGEEVIVEIRSIPKNNGICREGLLIREPDSAITPTIYLQQIYDAWRNDPVPLDELADRILGLYRRERKNLPEDVSFFTDFFSARRHIYLRLIHYGRNSGMLKRMPHQRILDLAVVCYYRMKDHDLDDATISVMEEHRRLWKVSEERLFAIARANTLRDQKICFMDMERVIREFAGDGEWTQDVSFREDAVPMYILTNHDKMFGAFCIFYPHVQQHISDYLDASFYVIPSSIHEVILVPDSGQVSGHELRAMVTEINHSHVEPMEVLSDNVYYYDREEGKLALFEK